MVYRVPGEHSPRTETYKSEDEALIRDMQIKLSKRNGTFVPPMRLAKGIIEHKKELTVQEYMEEYVENYGTKKWGNSHYSACKGLIKNYIDPYLGNRFVRSITVKDIDQYYTMLLDQPAVITSGHMDTGAKIGAHTVSRIHKLLKSAFGKAVAWEYADQNPTLYATLPECRSEKRAVWSDDEALLALNVCDNPVLKICLYLAIGCSLRLGEILGLQWANVHIEDELVTTGEAYIKIDRELRRCSNESIEVLEKVNRSTIMFKFPKIMPKKATTTLVLKAPKTESSNRTIYLPMAVIEELRKVRTQQEEYKRLLGDEYTDYDLVVAQVNGRPYEQRPVDKMFSDLIRKNGLRPVVFHSTRHCSTSIKLKLSRGNVKAVQGDTGHAEARMVTDVYSRGFDADRKIIAQEMNEGFFAKVGQKPEALEPDQELMLKLRDLIKNNPALLEKIFAESAS